MRRRSIHVLSHKQRDTQKLMNLSQLPDDVIQEIAKLVFHSLHAEQLKKVLVQYRMFLLEDSDMGTIILRRIDGMPRLETID